MAQPLPYDMGNAGDLMKHGLLAEFTQWWCRVKRKPIRFIDYLWRASLGRTSRCDCSKSSQSIC